MEKKKSLKNGLVFGLDIGTRTIVGVVGMMEHSRFKVVAMAQSEHETRAMLDGQIHDIYKVGDTIRKVKNELEKQLQVTLNDVCIAAAGRVLKTVNSSAEYSFDEETRITQEHIYSLNLLAVENAHNMVNEEGSDVRFYCVGNTPIRFKLNGYDINNLEGHKASKIGVELIATFLPEEVVDGLYEAVEYAGLHVASLTLEPIAAMNVAIPEQYRLLNIGLVDVGAGTSDICITKDGSVIAYGMIPYAGDEITETIAKNYLVDFNTADKIKISASGKKKGLVTFKDIMGITQKVQASEIQKIADKAIETMTKEVADKIKELNGGKPVNAVFVVGGGGKMPGYTDMLADYLGIVKERVAVRGEEVLTSVDFDIDNFKKDSLYVTPVGICTNYYSQKNNFVFVTVNNDRVKMYDNNRLTVVDAIMQVGYPNELLFPRRGAEIKFTVDGKARLVRGSAGEGAVVTLNGKQANLNSPIEQNDVIVVKESTVGEPASITIGQLDEFNSVISFVVNEKNVSCPRFAYVNGELKSEFYDICDGDKIRMENFYTVKQLFEFLDFDTKGLNVYVNNELADKNTRVYENFSVRTVDSATDSTSNSSKAPVAYSSSTSEEINDYVADSSSNEKLNKDEYIAAAPKQTILKSLEDDNEIGKISDEFRKTIMHQYTEDTDKEEKEENKEVPTNISVIINDKPVILSGKSQYIVVDLFDFYPFDLSKPKGNLVFLHNGANAEYTSVLSAGDKIELRWEEI
ncbi:MAG: cell division FtsA domain-containing protein [Lachnospira sp.]